MIISLSLEDFGKMENIYRVSRRCRHRKKNYFTRRNYFTYAISMKFFGIFGISITRIDFQEIICKQNEKKIAMFLRFCAVKISLVSSIDFSGSYSETKKRKPSSLHIFAQLKFHSLVHGISDKFWEMIVMIHLKWDPSGTLSGTPYGTLSPDPIASSQRLNKPKKNEAKPKLRRGELNSLGRIGDSRGSREIRDTFILCLKQKEISKKKSWKILKNKYKKILKNRYKRSWREYKRYWKINTKKSWKQNKNLRKN